MLSNSQTLRIVSNISSLSLPQSRKSAVRQARAVAGTSFNSSPCPSAPPFHSVASEPLGVERQERRAIFWACLYSQGTSEGFSETQHPHSIAYSRTEVTPIFLSASSRPQPQPSHSGNPPHPDYLVESLSAATHHQHLQPLWILALLVFPSSAWPWEEIPPPLPLAEVQFFTHTTQRLIILRALRLEEDTSLLGSQFFMSDSASERLEVSRKHWPSSSMMRGRSRVPQMTTNSATQCFHTLDHILGMSTTGGLALHFGTPRCSAKIVLFSAFEALGKTKTESHLTFCFRNTKRMLTRLRNTLHSKNCLSLCDHFLIFPVRKNGIVFQFWLCS